MAKKEGEPYVGIDSYFFHPTAATELMKFYEAWVYSLGFKFSFRDADVLALATKIYGPAGYYPIWGTLDKGRRTARDGDTVILNAGKVGRISPETSFMYNMPYTQNNIQKLVTADTSNGPHMFKPLPDGWMPRWPQGPGEPRVEIKTRVKKQILNAKSGGSRHKRKSKKRSKTRRQR